MNNTDEFIRIEKLLKQEMSKVFVLPPSALVTVETEKTQSAIKKALDPIVAFVTSHDFEKLREIAEKAARQKQWATDPMDLMRYLDCLDLSTLRGNLANFLRKLSSSIDSDAE